ncbi:MAG: phage protein [Bacillales bacterium]|jgi:predicted DNA-binding transcriptional regulator AlpA|nr:phage protein [Bacillales bacterium]
MEVKIGNLDARREKAIVSLLREPTITSAAKAAGVGETTIYRWLQDDAFKKKYRILRKMALSQTILQLSKSTASAVKTLEEVMNDQYASSSSRVAASKAVLEIAFKAYEVDELNTRIEELENKIQNYNI